METENSNEQSVSGAKQTADRGGATADDRAKRLDSSSGGEAPASEGKPATTKKSGVASDDKSKDFDTADNPMA